MGDDYGFDHALVMVLPGGDRLPLERYLSDSPKWTAVARCERGALFRRITTPLLARLSPGVPAP